MAHAQIECIYSPKDLVNVNSSFIRNSSKLKTTKMFINGIEWIHYLQYSHTVEHYPAINKQLIYAMLWMNLTDITVGERKHRKKQYLITIT